MPPGLDPELIETTILHRGRKFEYAQLTLRTPEGHTLTREVVRHPGAVVVLPVLQSPQGPRVVYLLNHRPAVGRDLIELPAGTLEAGEEPTACAHRELIEEAGYDAATITPLTRFHTTPGLTDELMHAFVATDLKAVSRAPEPGECMTVHDAPAGHLLAMVEAGEITDAKSILSLLLAHRRGLLGGEGGA